MSALRSCPLIAVDPGIRGCGVATFEDGWLVGVEYVRNPVRSGNQAYEAAAMSRAVRGAAIVQVYSNAMCDLALEWPRVYATRIRRGESKGDPNDLLGLAAVDAALAAQFSGQVNCYFPSEWKGQMKKEVCHARIASRLHVSEATLVAKMADEAGSLAHNAWDAVGVGMHHLGRLARHRVIPT